MRLGLIPASNVTNIQNPKGLFLPVDRQHSDRASYCFKLQPTEGLLYAFLRTARFTYPPGTLQKEAWSAIPRWYSTYTHICWSWQGLCISLLKPPPGKYHTGWLKLHKCTASLLHQCIILLTLCKCTVLEARSPKSTGSVPSKYCEEESIPWISSRFCYFVGNLWCFLTWRVSPHLCSCFSWCSLHDCVFVSTSFLFTRTPAMLELWLTLRNSS